MLIVIRFPRPARSDAPVGAAGRHRGLRAMVELLGDELETQPPDATAVAPSLVDALLVYMLHAWLADTANTDGWSAALADPVIARALAAIHAEPARPWTVEQLAVTARLSRAAFVYRGAGRTGVTNAARPDPAA